MTTCGMAGRGGYRWTYIINHILQKVIIPKMLLEIKKPITINIVLKYADNTQI